MSCEMLRGADGKHGLELNTLNSLLGLSSSISPAVLLVKLSSGLAAGPEPGSPLSIKQRRQQPSLGLEWFGSSSESS